MFFFSKSIFQQPKTTIIIVSIFLGTKNIFYLLFLYKKKKTYIFVLNSVVFTYVFTKILIL